MVIEESSSATLRLLKRNTLKEGYGETILNESRCKQKQRKTITQKKTGLSDGGLKGGKWA